MRLVFAYSNEVLIKMNGSLFPFGWLTFLREKKRISQVRCMALGVVPEFRKRGVDAILYYYSMQEGIKRKQKDVEFSWMLEDNLDILRGLEVFGGRIYRRYRLLLPAGPFRLLKQASSQRLARRSRAVKGTPGREWRSPVNCALQNVVVTVD